MTFVTRIFGDIELPVVGTITGNELTAGLFAAAAVTVGLRKTILYDMPSTKESFIAAGGSIFVYLLVLHFMKKKSGKPSS